MAKYIARKCCAGAFNFQPDDILDLSRDQAAELGDAVAPVEPENPDPEKKPPPKKKSRTVKDSE